MDLNLIIENVLEEKRNVLKYDYDKYKNHVYRVYHLCLKIDKQTANRDKYAIASAFHDLGIWTHQTFDYLEPSISHAGQYLDKIGKPEWKDEVGRMIDMHHKWSRYSGQNEKTVETFRRADWIDITKGRINFNIDRKEISELEMKFPTFGFHRFLLKQSVENFLKHPLNPLPMLKK
jgi:HD domain